MLAGHGSLVLVGGDAGVGKTTLVEATLTEARAILESLEARPALARADALAAAITR